MITETNISLSFSEIILQLILNQWHSLLQNYLLQRSIRLKSDVKLQTYAVSRSVTGWKQLS